MMELDESLRSLYFAPVPLIVLSSIRAIKMINKTAEKILGLKSKNCAGLNIERFIHDSSRYPFRSAIHAATEGATVFHNEESVATQVQLHHLDMPSSSITVDLSISAWYATDPMFEDDIDTSNRPSSSRVSHEALYTISLVPCTTIGLQDSSQSSEESRESLTSVLKESIFHCLDNGIIALSKDGKTEVRNQSFDNILSISPAFSQRINTFKEKNKDGDSGIVAAVEETVTVWDEEFKAALETTEWPIFKCAFLGQTFPPVFLGLESKSTGQRSIVEFYAKPIRDKAGYGEHIGGVVSLRDVTTLRRKQNLVAEMQNDDHFRQIIDQMPQLIWVASGTGYVEWYSQSFMQYTGYSQQELQGAGWSIIIQEDDLADISEKWSTAIRTKSHFETAVRIRKHDGQNRWYLSRGTPLKDPNTGDVVRWYGTCTDIDDQVKALSASRKAQDQLQSVVSHAAVTLWAIDKNGIITMAEGPGIRDISSNNSKGQQSNMKQSIKGKKDMVGQSIYEIWGLGDIRESVNNAVQGRTVVDEIEIGQRWYRNSYTPLRVHGKDYTFNDDSQVGKELSADAVQDDAAIIGVVIASMDITDRKEAQKRIEETLLEKTRALSAEGAAQEASRLKSEFLANMSHEIRTPIAGIIGLTELLLDGETLTPLQGEFAQTIQRSAEGLLTVINDVLDFSKVEVGKLELEQSPFNLSDLLGDLNKMLTFTTQKKGLDLQIIEDKRFKDQLLLGDLGRVRQVVTNLLTNSIKFTDKGHVILKVTVLSGQDDGDVVKVQFDVRDTGCGIKPEVLARLFQPFVQADATTARRFGGTGLGLSIAKNLVKLMDGEIGLNSEEGKGSHAWFIIPFGKVSNEGISRSISTPLDNLSKNTNAAVMVPSRSLSHPRKDIWILIAEDNHVNATIASQNVQKLGFNCKIAANGKIALSELHNHPYDLVLMDCQMPVCDGYEATRLIRQSDNINIQTLPIIALTASAIKGDRERAINAGMVDYLAKPVRRSELESTLCKWLFDQAARQTLASFVR